MLVLRTALPLLCVTTAFAQSLAIAPKAVQLGQVEGGPLASGSISIRASGDAEVEWTATAATATPADPWLQLRSSSGTTPSVLVLTVGGGAERRSPGKYQAKVTIQSGAKSETVPVEWEVRPAGPPPAFTAVAGPNGCAPSPGYPDPPLCTPLPVPSLLNTPSTGATYTDPNFGGRVRVVTGPETHHAYSTPSPLSATGKHLIVLQDDGNTNVADAASGRVLVARARCNQGCFWDATDDEVYYNVEGGAILKHEVRGNKTTTLIDYAKQPDPMHEIERGGTGDTSKDNWVSFWAPDEKRICAVDLTNVKTYCADYAATQRRLPYGDIDFTLISKGKDSQSGKRYVMLVAPPAMGVFSVDEAAGVLKLEFRGPEEMERNGNRNGICDPGERCLVGSHLDTLEDAAGIQYLVMNGETSLPCEYSLSTYQLNKGIQLTQPVEAGGGRKRVMTLWKCGPGWVDEHVGCAKAAPYCVISTQSVPRPSNNFTEVPPTPHGGEIFVMKGNGEEIRRVALSRSVRFNDGSNNHYWATPRAAISNDASLIVSDTNFGTKQPRVTIIETGIGGKK